ncbi:MAG: Uncharacterized protein F083_1328 [bacterium F083]|nr:MAG: Uncharacterized protein AUK64_1009 [bacterium P201]KWW40794.1 MAG: Uncharacterized protein F083_1328 [bacterium F083]
MKNPWDNNRIIWGDPFADGDREALAKMGYLLCSGKEKKFDKLMKCVDLESKVSNEKLDEMYWGGCLDKYANYAGDAGLDFHTLPEPYTGDVNSPVYCLNMNPGEADPLFDNDSILLLLTWLTLQHSLPFVFWSNPGFNKYKKTDEKGKLHPHSGCTWFASKTKELGERPNLFMIEYFPYHSNHGFVFPSWLPSYAYTNALIEKAMDDGKFIIIMRQKKRWFKRVPRLEHYSPLAFLSNPQNASLSKDNVVYKLNAFNDLVTALKKQE